MENEVRARILDAVADDKDVIAYRPKLRALTKSALGAILLQQILFRAKNNHWKPFYKFAAPCGHQDYSAGDSWTEELGFSEGEVETARSYIGSKVTHGKSRESFADNALVFYWTDSNRKTWYQVNEDLLESLLSELYSDENAKGGIALYLEKRFPALTKKAAKAPLHSSETSESTETIPLSAENSPLPEKPADPPTVKAAKARIQVAAVEGAASAGKRRGVADPRKAAKDEREQMQGDVVRVWTQGGQAALPDVTSIAHKIAFDHYAAIESGTITREQWRGAIENLMNGGGNKYRDGTAKDVWMVGKDIDDFVRTGPRQSWDSIPRFRAED